MKSHERRLKRLAKNEAIRQRNRQPKPVRRFMLETVVMKPK